MNQKFWQDKYNNEETPWDLGYVSPTLSAYFQNLYNKKQKILIAGAGNSYEAQWLWEQGFKNIWIVDIVKEPLDNLKLRCPTLPENQLLHMDFFDLEDTFDLIIEQTFFCALNPNLRADYCHKMSQLLQCNGKLTGLLFDFPLTKEGPPFGGSSVEYQNLFKPFFKLNILETSYNSIKPRQGKELFFEFIRR